MQPEYFISAVSAVIAVASAIFAFNANRNNRHVAATQIFLQLRENYLLIQATLPPRLRELNWVAEVDSDDWRKLEAYWYQIFNEWFITRKLYGGVYKDLWNEFYAETVKSALKHSSIRHVYYSMRHEKKYAFAGHGADFSKVIEEAGELDFIEDYAALKERHQTLYGK